METFPVGLDLFHVFICSDIVTVLVTECSVCSVQKEHEGKFHLQKASHRNSPNGVAQFKM